MLAARAAAFPLETAQVLRHHTGAIRELILDETGSRIVSSDSAGWVAYWDTGASEPLWSQKAMGVRLTGISASADLGELVAGGCAEEAAFEPSRWQIIRWKMPGGDRLSVLDGFAQSFDRLVVSSGLRHAALVACGQRTGNECLQPDITLLQPPAWRPHGQPAGPRERITEFRFSPSGNILLAAGCDAVNHDRTCSSPVIRLIESSTGETQTALKPAAIVNAAAFTADGSQFVTAASDGSVELWDIATRKSLRRFQGGRAAATAAAVSSDGKQLAWGTYDGVLWTWRPDTGKVPLRTEIRTGPIHALAFSGDATKLAAGGADRLIRIYRVMP